ncbi:Elongation factor Ts (EF-Ts) [Candidatus Phytoplasma australiense]|uniref:Elongation factor Ts n=2 Tax=Phytoplasma australiense TaxID=59748 RepID=EFTS_PHYAS|nr:translation elongation factor Ts [Candidatus Phytoplasma australiense]B1VA79.1 RecName: Full=Elongation factor Ts; Short=EF-Ts [Candidatus Phytoplasma australiense]CAM11852.1 Elongation factor Ts (EF-Ts) [Candidatus Phytoplasma australiense]
MKITAEMIKELRQQTHAGMIACKQALEKTEGNLQKAIVFLREKGIVKASQKQDRTTSEGLINIVFSQNDAFLYELNSETDFVAKNEHFQQLMKTIGEVILQNKLQSVDEVLTFNYQNKTIQDLLLEKTSILGEKITLKRILKVTKKEEEIFGTYKHQGGRISVLVVLENNHPSIAEDIAMHIAAFNPKFLNPDKVNLQFLTTEKNILQKQTEKQLLEEKKPLHILDKIVQNRLNKLLKEICLSEQPFVKNNEQKVKDYLQNNNTNVVSYFRWSIANQ